MGNMKQMMPILMLLLIIVVIGFVYLGQGIAMHNQVAVDEANFNNLQQSYFTNSKAVRDSAETGSALNQDLATIQQAPSQLLFLKLVGIGKLLTGIFALLFAILLVLFMMPIRLAKMMKGPNQ